MSKAFSLYLDLVRFAAALLVLLYHSNNDYGLSHVLFNMGHEAVVIFFVMSGFIIAFCRDTKEKTLPEYLINRASRIYSVALPAVILTLVLDLWGAQLAPDYYGDHYDLPWVRILSSLAFTNELWLVSIQSFSNVPYWSITYEVWYYLMFAAAFYLKRGRLMLLLLIVLVVGPKILMLAPCWWAGVWLYYQHPLRRLPVTANLFIFIASVAAFCAFIEFEIAKAGFEWFRLWLGSELFREFTFSRYFLSDYLLAVIVAVNFAAARALLASVELNSALLTQGIRYLANLTFALYLLHQPLLNLFSALLIAHSLPAPVVQGLILVLTLMVILIIGPVLERRKAGYRQLFHAIARRVRGATIGKGAVL